MAVFFFSLSRVFFVRSLSLSLCLDDDFLSFAVFLLGFFCEKQKEKETRRTM
jgi:hypothetical protein